MIQEARLKRLFLDLISINAPSLDEKEVVDWTLQYLEANNLEAWTESAAAQLGGNADNVIAHLPANAEGRPRIFLSAHFDTVEPTPNLVVIEEDGVIRSDGTSILGADDKGGMAPAIEAVLALRESGLPHGDVYLLLSVAEEIGLLGASVLKIEDLNLDYGYVLDTGPPVGTFVTRTATHDHLRVFIEGKPAHAGKDPEHGINAIQVLADAVTRMKLGRIGPETTANLGIVRGGTATNVVCPFVELEAEARSTNEAELDAQIGHMIVEFEAAAARFGATVSIEHHRHYHAYDIPENSPVVQVAKRALTAQGFAGTSRTTLGGSDANIYNAKGVPTIVLATGMDRIHTHEEFIRLDDLYSTAKVALAILIESGGSPKA